MQETIIIYGIANCDTVKKALKWLEKHQIMHNFHDFRGKGISFEMINEAYALFGEALLNKRSTTWRQLDETQKQHLNEEKIKALLHTYPTLIKRPLILQPPLLGFSEQTFSDTFLKS